MDANELGDLKAKVITLEMRAKQLEDTLVGLPAHLKSISDQFAALGEEVRSQLDQTKIKAEIMTLETAMAITISSLRVEERAGIVAMLEIARNESEDVALHKANAVASASAIAWDRLMGDVHRLL